MEQIGGKPGPTINIHQGGKKISFSFFFFLGGAIQMKIVEGKKEMAVVFNSMEDFEKRAIEKGLPSEFIGTVSRAYQ